MPAAATRLASRLVLGGLFVAAVAVGAWFVSQTAADPERLRAELIQGIRKSTGRELTLSGPIHLSLGLSPSFTAEGVALANIPGGSRPQMVTAASLRGRVALLPLLGGDLVIEDLALFDPDILLERDQAGTPNWQMKPARHALYESNAALSPPASGDRGGRVEIQHFHIQGGRFTWRPSSGPPSSGPPSSGPPSSGPVLSFGIGRLDASTDSDSAPTHVTAELQAGGEPFHIDVAAGTLERLRGGPVTALAGAWPLTVNLTGGGAALKLEGGVNHPDEMRGYAFLVTGNAPDLTPLAAMFPQMGLLPLKEVNFTARLTDGSAGQLRTSGLSLHAGPSDLGAVAPGLVIKEAVFSAPGPGQQAQLNVDGVFAGAPLRLAGTATQPDTLEPNVPVPVVFTAQAATATLSARGTIPPGLDQNGYDLTVTARLPNLADMSPLAGRSLPAIHDLVIDARVGDAGTRLRGIDLRDISLTSSIGDLAGQLTVAWMPVRSLSGTVQARHLDLDAARDAFATERPQPDAQAVPLAIRAPETAAESAPDRTAASRLIPDTHLPFSVLHGANADLTVSAAEVTAGGEQYHDLAAHMLLADGRLSINPLRVSAPQGAVVGGLSVDAGLDSPRVAVSFRAPAISAAILTELLGHSGAATGNVQVDAQLSGVGDTPRALAATAGGHLGLSMVNGQITEAAFQGALGDALAAAGVPAMVGTSQIRCLAWRTDLSHGLAKIRVFSLETQRFSMDGTGSFDLADETLGLHLRPATRLGGTGIAAPVSLSGHFTMPKAALDPVLEGGRVGISIGGRSSNGCIPGLAVARGGVPGPMPSFAQDNPTQIKKPIDLLRGLFH